MPPYLFRRKNKARDIGKKAIFECISCAKNDVRNYAHAIKYEGLDGEYHELVHWPNDHDCAPSATSHLARIFTKRCYDAVETDPTKSIKFIKMLELKLAMISLLKKKLHSFVRFLDCTQSKVNYTRKEENLSQQLHKIL